MGDLGAGHDAERAVKAALDFVSADGSIRCRRCHLHPEQCPCSARKQPRRERVRGFVGSDGRTHAAHPESQRLTGGDAILVSRCPRNVWADASHQTAFIANPKRPLCLACVSAIEDEIRGEK